MGWISLSLENVYSDALFFWRFCAADDRIVCATLVSCPISGPWSGKSDKTAPDYPERFFRSVRASNRLSRMSIEQPPQRPREPREVVAVVSFDDRPPLAVHLRRQFTESHQVRFCDRSGGGVFGRHQRCDPSEYPAKSPFAETT